MINRLKSNLTNSYLMFVFDFADPSTINSGDLAKQIGCPIADVFKSQKQADKVKKTIGRLNFGKILVCYFNQFQCQDGIDFKALDKELSKHRKVFLRHLGKDKVSFLSLLISVSQTLDHKPETKPEHKRRGLLHASA